MPGAKTTRLKLQSDWKRRRFRWRYLWDPSSQELDWRAGVDQKRTRAGGHQPGFALAEGLLSDVAAAREKDQQMKAAGLGKIL